MDLLFTLSATVKQHIDNNNTNPQTPTNPGNDRIGTVCHKIIKFIAAAEISII